MSIHNRFVQFLNHTGLLSKMARTDFDKYLKRYASEGRTLDVGAGGHPYKRFFPNRISVDIESHEGVDVVADAHDLKPFKNKEFDVVLCTEALEHFYNPFKAIEELKRVLKKGGTLILTTRFIFPLHEVPHDYFRFTEYGLKYLLRDFEIKEFHEDGNTIDTLAILYQRIGYQTVTLGWRPLKLLWFVSAKLTLLFSKVLTREYGDINQKERVSHIMTSGYFVVAKKK